MASGNQLIIERILRDRAGIWDQIIGERDLPKLILRMLLTSAISLAAYGAVLGASNGWLQSLVSTVKLPLLFLATLAICLPTLYLFNLVFGARLSVLQACALIMVAITVTAVLTFAFAPISLFFLITARSYAFFKLLNVAILTLTALIGLRFLTSGMRALNEQVVGESMLSNQVVVTADVSQRELVSATVGGAAGPAAQPRTNGDASTALWFEDGVTTGKNPSNSPFSVAAPVNVQLVPEPGSIGLLGIASLGLLARRRTKKA